MKHYTAPTCSSKLYSYTVSLLKDKYKDTLSDWEEEFVYDVQVRLNQGTGLTTTQIDKLKEIHFEHVRQIQID